MGPLNRTGPKTTHLKLNKDLQRNGRGALDYRVNHNSGVVVVKWMENKVVELALNFVGVEQMSTVQQWIKATTSKKATPCPQVNAYNKSMDGVDLADMMITLYRISAKTKHWYIKVFWYLIYICKVNG